MLKRKLGLRNRSWNKISFKKKNISLLCSSKVWYSNITSYLLAYLNISVFYSWFRYRFSFLCERKLVNCSCNGTDHNTHLNIYYTYLLAYFNISVLYSWFRYRFFFLCEMKLVNCSCDPISLLLYDPLWLRH